MSTKLTACQKDLLKQMDKKNLGAIHFNGKWHFKNDIRTNPALAEQIIIALVFAAKPTR